MTGKSLHKEKTNIAEKIFSFLFVIVPIILLISGVVAIIIHITRNGIIGSFFDIFSTRVGWFFEYGATFVSVYMGQPMELGFRLISMAMVLFLGSILFVAHLEKIQCPCCHHFFSMHRISNDEYLGSTFRDVSEKTYDYQTARSVTSRGDVIVTDFITENRQYGVEETRQYQYDIQCSLCGCITNTSKERTYTTWE